MQLIAGLEEMNISRRFWKSFSDFISEISLQKVNLRNDFLTQKFATPKISKLKG